jgi:transcriptional regulator with XRE-family HTH domain
MARMQRFRRTFIRQWREHRGLTLEQLAERVDRSTGSLSMLERGERGYSQEGLEALAEALQTDPASLLMHDPTGTDDVWAAWIAAPEADQRQAVEAAEALRLLLNKIIHRR